MSNKTQMTKAWGIFVDGKLDHTWPSESGNMLPVFSVFKTRREAKLRGKDVRRVIIKECKIYG